jgi:uncharacterized protein
MEPTKPKERLIEIDVLRGVAVLGMVLWDFGSHSMGNYYVAGAIDRLAYRIVDIIDVNNTIHLIFAFLFGWGMAMPMLRSKAKGEPFVGLELRRLLALFILGAANCILVDRSDFLYLLAMAGAVALLFANRSNRTLLSSAVLLIAVPVLSKFIFSRVLSPESFSALFGVHAASFASLNPQYVLSASYGGLVLMRAHELLGDLAHPLSFIWIMDMVVMFLFGFYAARRNVFRDISSNIRFIRKVLWCSLAVRLLALGSGFALQKLEIPEKGATLGLATTWGIVGDLVKSYSPQAFALFYICLVVVLLQNNMLKRMSRPVADVGQLALSNYFLHDLIGTTLFFGYGLALHGKLGYGLGKGLAVLSCVFLLVISSWWTRRFQFGPAEWLWRCATYWRFPRFRRPPSESKAVAA